MTDLEKYQKVNSCQTLADLQKCIIEFADENGMIQGKERLFNAKIMASRAEVFYTIGNWAESVTREFGLRQQLMYLRHYKK